jgi:hypothetical protein
MPAAAQRSIKCACTANSISWCCISAPSVSPTLPSRPHSDDWPKRTDQTITIRAAHAAAVRVKKILACTTGDGRNLFEYQLVDGNSQVDMDYEGDPIVSREIVYFEQ